MAHILLQNKKKKTDTLSQSVAKSLTYDLLPGLIGQCACFCSHHGWVAFFSCIWNYISWVQNAFWCVFDVPLKSWGWSIWWCREGVTIRCHFFFPCSCPSHCNYLLNSISQAAAASSFSLSDIQIPNLSDSFIYLCPLLVASIAKSRRFTFYL